MKLLSKNINLESLNLYYNSYVLPMFDFSPCCLVWGHTTAGNQLRLVKLQKRAARLILKAGMLTPSDQMYKTTELAIFSKTIVQYHTCLMVYKGINGQSPEYVSSMLTLVSEHHERRTRSTANNKLHVPRSHTTYYEKAFSTTGPRLWNSLPTKIKESEILFKFKHALKHYLLHGNKTVLTLAYHPISNFNCKQR